MEKERIKRFSSLLSLFFTFSVDNLGATIIFPIFAPLFMEVGQRLFAPDFPITYRTTLLGLFYGIFPLMQFLFAPLLGEYADRQGRRKALLLTAFLTLSGFAFSAVGIHDRSLLEIFFGRMLMGLGAGNLSVCLSALSDLSPRPKEKVKYFSYGSAVAGFTFILGPFLGGKLSDSSLSSLFHPAFPMWIGASLALVNLLFLFFAFQETIKEKSQKPFDFIKGIHGIQIILQTKSIKRLYLIYFFYLFSWTVIYLFIPAFLVDDFELSNSKIGDICALMGGCWVFGTAVLHRLFFKVARGQMILKGAFILFSLVVLFIPFMKTITSFVLILGVCTMISGLSWPLCTGAISNAASPEMQGKVLGLSQSMLSLTMMLSSLVGGLFIHSYSFIPFILSSLSTLIAFIILLMIKN
ncbi:MAG: MFS transporter [Simkania negevensis]|nr:MFS transporter [Simkania negevensis]